MDDQYIDGPYPAEIKTVLMHFRYADWPGDMAICVHATAKGVGEVWYLVYETRQVSMLSPYRVGMFRRG